jgi:hypothetical protein
MLELRAEANRASVSLNDKTAIMLLWHAILLKRNPKHTMQKDGLP